MYNRNVLFTVGSEELDQYYSERTIKGWCTVMSQYYSERTIKGLCTVMSQYYSERTIKGWCTVMSQYYSERTIKGLCTVISLIEADILSKIYYLGPYAQNKRQISMLCFTGFRYS